jgi:D-psicose/D-tagatose/L-ribulose 3-epimerase
MTRRTLLVALFAAKPPFRFAICNETFEGVSFGDSCRLAKATGYEGVEIAPVTLGSNPVLITRAARKEARRAIERAGVRYVGMHSLVSTPSGLHLTTPDATVRRRSWEYFVRLIDLAADLGDRPVMVLGSGKQRASVSGATPVEARARLVEGLSSVAPHAQSRNVTILIEPLSPQFTDVINTMAEAVAAVREINTAAVSSMFDTHNTVAETKPHDEVIRENAAYIKHVHVNELDGRHPGSGRYDFGTVARALREIRYSGWVSLEVFQFKPSGEVVAREAMTVMRRW